MSRPKAALLAMALYSLASSRGGASSCAVQGSPSFGNASIVSITYSNNFPNVAAIQDAADFWNGASCGTAGGAGFDYPFFSMGTDGSRTLNIQFQTGHAATKQCGPGGNTVYCTASRSGATITIYGTWGADGTTLTHLDTATLGNTLAHEMGHTLGLREDACPNGIMNQPIPTYPDVTFDECTMVDGLNTVKFGSYVEPPDNCDDYQCTFSPIVINLGQGPYRLSSLDDGVWFDINADGVLDRMAWTAGDANEAFLWLDRNSNGVADNGAELFGDQTIVPEGALAPNGFVALRGLDSNSDGTIDSRDAVWSLLLLWIDRNHDGISQPEEICHISDSPIQAISLDYSASRRFDEFGNLFRFRSTVVLRTPNGELALRPVYDVFFVVDLGPD